MKARANSAASTDASSASPPCGTSKRVGLPVLQRLATDSRAELDYVRMVGKPEIEKARPGPQERLSEN